MHLNQSLKLKIIPTPINSNRISPIWFSFYHPTTSQIWTCQSAPFSISHAISLTYPIYRVSEIYYIFMGFFFVRRCIWAWLMRRFRRLWMGKRKRKWRKMSLVWKGVLYCGWRQWGGCGRELWDGTTVACMGTRKTAHGIPCWYSLYSHPGSKVAIVGRWFVDLCHIASISTAVPFDNTKTANAFPVLFVVLLASEEIPYRC